MIKLIYTPRKVKTKSKSDYIDNINNDALKKGHKIDNIKHGIEKVTITSPSLVVSLFKTEIDYFIDFTEVAFDADIIIAELARIPIHTCTITSYKRKSAQYIT